MMDIGTLINNSIFYDGYEGEPEVELFIAENPEINIHIWGGYISDIFDKPVFSDEEWTGFTRDYQQEIGTYDARDVAINVEEYLDDLINYEDKHFRYEETSNCFILLRDFLKYAKANGKTVKVNWAS